MDFLSTVREVHPSLEDSEASKCISNETIDRLANAIQKLREVKIQRMQKLQDLATTMLELWNLMDTPVEEQQVFQSVTCNIAAKEHEINEPNNLSVDFINYVEAEVARLEELKESKMKELVLKKRTELEEICRKTHVDADEETTMEYAVAAIESGTVDPSCILEQIEAQIAKVKEDAFSRKEILDKVDKWLVACDEENWLEDYNKDENRYNAGRGAHLTLKRAEKARAAVSKIPATVEALVVKTTVWERERGKEFMYNGVRLLSMLEDYNILRQEKEQERKRQRDQKKLQGQLIAEQEALFGSKPSPSKTPSARKLSRTSTGSTNRRLSLGGPMMHTQTLDFLPPTKASAHGARQTKKAERPHSSHNHHQDDSFAALSAGRRGLDIAGLPARKQSLYSTNNPEPETPSTQRKPFSPVSTKPNTASNSLLDDHVKLQNINFAKNAPIKTTNLPSTPSTNKHQISATDEENRTPQSIAVPFLNTPSSVSMPMQTAMTPMHMVSATPAALFGHVQRSPAEIEYSFEERRAGFVYCQ
ncbi:hypothetical protein AMTR_s00041p00052270 [Amborella trichopoda]|uniref:65-kDa microtubule-associated protein 3 n=2 Tax=Amborella trichopoda TaxID=13333 RepID=W1PYC0_AMBTC|nr:hypothetical protein AMTR_s00041p00052270 [Amborella trichopoda]